VEVCHENNHNGAPRSPPRRPCAGYAFAGFRDAADGATDPPGDMINYCIYAGLIYSVGSQMCVAKGSSPLYCDQPI
jgi:hypothetical protein